MSHIVAIGGGEIRSKETFLIDKYIVKLSMKKNPNFLFIPTASNDNKGYWDIVNEIYGKELRCNVKGIFFTKKIYSKSELETLLSWADIIYVGGGNTKRMLDIWNKNNFIPLLKKFHKQNGKILSGISAGAMCWFRYGNSDSPLFENPNSKIKTEKIKWLGFINAAFCPHYNTEEFRPLEFKTMMKQIDNCVGLALDNNCAIHIYNRTYKIIKSNLQSNLHKLHYTTLGILQYAIITENNTLSSLLCR